MARQANGTYIAPANTAAVSGQTISSTAFNTLTTDIGTELTNSLDRGGRSAMTASLPMGNNTITGVAPPVNATDGATKAYVDAVGTAAALLPTDKVVTLRKLYHPTGTSLLLGTDSNAALTITGAANNGSGLIRLTVGSSATFGTGQTKTVSDVLGTTEANGTWVITVISGTTIDLQGSTFANTYISGGTIGGGWEEITLGSGVKLTGSVLSATLNPTLVPNYLSGLTLSTAGSSATFGIAAGVANDSTNTTLMLLASAYTKTTSAWAVGSGNGALDTSTVAINTWYHVYLIERTDTGVVDVLFSLNPTAASPNATPTLPTNYTLFRRIGSMKTNGSSQWTSFTQFVDQFTWAATVAESPSFTAARTTLTMAGVPTGVFVNALFRAELAANSTGQNGTIFAALTENDVAVTNFNADLLAGSAGGGGGGAGAYSRLTNTSAQIAVRSLTAVTGTLNINTYGWIDGRGK